jgi:tetratricopeptide (TPR) repeat protein
MFQGFVDVDALRLMGDSAYEWHLPEVRGMNRDSGIALLDRAAEVGLLTPYSNGYYSIHPAVPWFFKKMFDEYYADSVVRAEQAFVKAIAGLGNYYSNLYKGGRPDVIGILASEEPNLLYARQLARTHGWWHALVETMQGLDELYDHTGRHAEWARLVNKIVPDFIDPVHGGPLPGREEEWGLINDYRVRIFRKARQWVEAEQLQNACVERDRKRATVALTLPPGELEGVLRDHVRTLAAGIHGLGQIQRAMNQPTCVESYKECYELALRIGDKRSAGVAALNLGNAYKDLPSLRNLDEAERWCRRDLELESDADQMGRAKALMQLGSVNLQRFKDGQPASEPSPRTMADLNKALQLYLQSLDVLPTNAIEDLAVVHVQLGNIYDEGINSDLALGHYRKSINYYESAGNLYGAAQTRYNVAIALAGEVALPMPKNTPLPRCVTTKLMERAPQRKFSKRSS